MLYFFIASNTSWLFPFITVGVFISCLAARRFSSQGIISVNKSGAPFRAKGRAEDPILSAAPSEAGSQMSQAS